MKLSLQYILSAPQEQSDFLSFLHKAFWPHKSEVEEAERIEAGQTKERFDWFQL